MSDQRHDVDLLEDGAPARLLDPSTLLITLCWALVVLPRLAQSFTAPKYRTSVGAQLPYSRISQLLERGLGIALALTCVWIVVRGLRDLPTTRRTALLVLLAPWVFMVSRDLYLHGRPQIEELLYPAVVGAVWVLRPRIERLRLLGLLVGATAVIAVLMGALVPAKGVFLNADTGQLIAPEKQILPWGVLIGPFTDANNLAQFLVLGLPAIALVRERLLRAVLAAVTVFAIVWTSSRSSITAVVVAAVLALVLGVSTPPVRRWLGAVLLLALAATVVALPLAFRSDEAFTNRGYIWRISLAEWARKPVLGHGSDWYSDVAKYANSLGGNAFHGHNQFVHTLVTGGLIYLALTAMLVLLLIGSAAAWAGRGFSYPVVYVGAWLTSCTLEVSFGVVDRAFLLAVTVLPMAFIALADPLPRVPDPLPHLHIRHPAPRPQPALTR